MAPWLERRSWLVGLGLMLLASCPQPAYPQRIHITNAPLEKALSLSNVVNVANTNFMRVFDALGGLTNANVGKVDVTNGVHNVIATGSLRTKSVQDRFGKDVVHLSDWATPDDEGDARDNIQKALNHAQGRTLLIDPGNYRIVGTKPIVVGRANIRGMGGRLWVSLPDGYSNSNDYVSSQSYTDEAAVDENGQTNSWTSTVLNMPWNGKTQIFTGATNCVIEGLWIDGGWGTTNPPAGVIPITGIRNDNEEFTYYQIFNDSRNVTFVNCRFRNVPGAAIEVGYNVTVRGCTFEEWGDHAIYFGQDGTQHNYLVEGNQFVAKRGQTSSLGSAGFVFRTFRDALKFRGNKGVQVLGNLFTDENDLIVGIRLEVNSAQPGDVVDPVVSGNNFKGALFMDLVASRTAGAVDHRIVNAIIAGNTIRVTDKAFQAAGAAIDGLKIENNTIHSGGSVANFAGNPRYVKPLKRIKFSNNHCVFSGGTAISVAGTGTDFVIDANNRFYCEVGTVTTSHNLITFGNSFVNDGIPVNAQETAIDDWYVMGNYVDRMNSLALDGSYPAYAAGTTYAYASHAMPEGTVEVFSVVESGGVLYRNTAAVTGTAPPSAPWQSYTRKASRWWVEGNSRWCSEGSLSPNNSTYLLYLSGPAATLRASYTICQRFNRHFNALSEAVTFSLGNVAESRETTGAKISGLNVSTITDVTSITGVSDLDIYTGQDQVHLFREQNGDMYLDLGFNSTGTKRLRLFTGTAAGITLGSDGTASGSNARFNNVYGNMVLATNEVITKRITAEADLVVTVLGEDQIRLFQNQNDPMYLDLGNGATGGSKHLRLWDTGNTNQINLMLSNNGDITNRGTINTAAVVIPGGNVQTLLDTKITKTSGTATLVDGTATVNTAAVTANSRIFLTVNTAGGTVGSPHVSARSAGVSFTITSTSGTDTSTVAWMLFEP